MSGDCVQGHNIFLPLTRLDTVVGIRNQYVGLIIFLFMWLPVLVPLSILQCYKLLKALYTFAKCYYFHYIAA